MKVGKKEEVPETIGYRGRWVKKRKYLTIECRGRWVKKRKYLTIECRGRWVKKRKYLTIGYLEEGRGKRGSA